MRISKNTWDLFIKEHTVNKLSVKAICKKYNMKYTTIYYGLKRHSIIPNASLTDRRKFKVDDSYFDIINTHKKAYILGLLLCDGSAQKRGTKKGRVYIKLKKSDRYILEAIRNEIAPGYKLTLGNSIKGNKTFYSYRLEIASDKLVDSLKQLGMVQDKFLRTLPTVPTEFFGSMIRGIFDADGSISRTARKGVANSHQVYIAGTNKEFIYSLQKSLNIGKIYLNKREHLGFKDMYYIRFNNIVDKTNLYTLMYLNTSIYLKRKLEMYTNYVNTVLNSESKFLNQRNAYQMKLVKENIILARVSDILTKKKDDDVR